MLNNFTIHFVSSKAPFGSTYTPSKRMQQPILKLYKWILNEHNDINVLLINTNHVFFYDIKCFCISNDIDYKKPLFLHAYIDKEKQLIYLKIEQGTYNKCINFDRNIFAKITCENNLDKKLTNEELNNLFTRNSIIK